MTDNMQPFDKLISSVKGAVANEVAETITGAMPNGVRFSRRNPDDDDEQEYGEDGEDAAAENPDDDDLEVGALCFEEQGASDNLAAAVGAYRMLATTANPDGAGDLVAQHAGTGYAFFGSPDELEEYKSATDRHDGWKVHDNPTEIMGMEYDEDTMREVLDMMGDPETATAIKGAEEQQEGWAWGNAPSYTGVKEIPGIHGPLMPCGIGRRLEYYSDKGGEPVEYFHDFGSKGDGNGGEYPGVYALGTRTIVIHGGDMEISDRGFLK